MYTVTIEDSELGPFINLYYMDACQLAIVLCGLLEKTARVVDCEATTIYTITPEEFKEIMK